jgi:hypothetical protein
MHKNQNAENHATPELEIPRNNEAIASAVDWIGMDRRILSAE